MKKTDRAGESWKKKKPNPNKKKSERLKEFAAYFSKNIKNLLGYVVLHSENIRFSIRERSNTRERAMRVYLRPICLSERSSNNRNI